MDKAREQLHEMMPLRPIYVLFLLMVLGFSWNSYADSERHVVIITSSDSSYQQQTAARIRQNLGTENTRTIIMAADDISSSLQNGHTLFVAIGEHAINSLDAFDKNAIVLRINNKKIAGTSYSSVQSDLITSQPACKDIQLIKAINPKWRSVGVLSSLKSADTTAELTKCAIRFDLNLRLYAITDESDLQKTLESAVENNKVLLATIDPLVYNSRTVKNILLTAYRHRKPVIGYSDSFVQAGAIAAIFTSPETAGDDAASIISEFFENNWQFRKKTYNPGNFSVSTNPQVATSLEISLPDIATIMNRIQQMDIAP